MEIELPADLRRERPSRFWRAGRLWTTPPARIGAWHPAFAGLRPPDFVYQPVIRPPKYVPRPEAELPDDAAARPVLHAGGHGGAARRGLRRRICGAGRRPWRLRRLRCPRPGKSQVGSRFTGDPTHAQTFLAQYSGANAAASELGELFEYRFAKPVTIRKSESAMLPFLQQNDRGAQAADLSTSTLRASHQRRRTHQFHRQNAGWRSHHGLRRRRLRRRSAHGNGEARRQAAHQLRGGPGHARSRRRSTGKAAWSAKFTCQSRHSDHAAGGRRDPHLHHSQCRSESQDA